jgi:hypothetical protein
MRTIYLSEVGHTMAEVHWHTWQTSSCHPTSEGTVSYQQCRCGLWQVHLGAGRVLATVPSYDAGS